MKKCKITRPYFCGVYALDELPKEEIKQRPAIVICNTAYSHSSGEHWVGFYLEDNKIEYFDSYGLPPDSAHFNRFISKNSNSEILYNKRQLQGLRAETCGKFVTVYMFYRSLGYTTHRFLDLFQSENPDELVRQMFEKIFKKTHCECMRGGQKCYKYGQQELCANITP